MSKQEMKEISPQEFLESLVKTQEEQAERILMLEETVMGLKQEIESLRPKRSAKTQMVESVGDKLYLAIQELDEELEGGPIHLSRIVERAEKMGVFAPDSSPLERFSSVREVLKHNHRISEPKQDFYRPV